MAKLTRDIEFLKDRTRVWHDGGLTEVFGDRTEFARWADETAVSKLPEQAIAAQLCEHRKADPQFANVSAIVGKDFDVSVSVKERGKGNR